MRWLSFSTVLCSGLMSGLLYGYSCSVNPALKTLSDLEYIKVMQSINHAIQNPVFFSTFVGLLFLFPLSSYRLYRHHDPSLWLFLAAMCLYVIGVFGVTMLFNVPLNDRLAGFNPERASAVEVAAMRQAFEKPWNTFHALRTAASILSFALTVLVTPILR